MLSFLDKYGGYILIFCIVGFPVFVAMLPLIVLLLCIFGVVAVVLIVTDKLKLNL